MSDTGNKLKLAVVCVALAGAGFFVWNYFHKGGMDAETLGAVATFDCSTCDKVFTKTQKELIALKDRGSNPPCPICGKDTTREVFACPFCGKAVDPVGHGRMPKTCPRCNHVLSE